MWLLLAITVGLLALSGVSLLIAGGVYLWMYIYTNIAQASDFQPIKPLFAVQPDDFSFLLQNPIRAIRTGVRQTHASLTALWIESHDTETLDSFEYTDNGTRFRSRGYILPKSRITAPITGKECAIAGWAIDQEHENTWEPVARGIHTNPFFITPNPNTADRIMVNPKADTEYDIQDGDTDLIEVLPTETIPSNLQQLLDEHAPDATGHLRFREIRVGAGSSISVFGEFREKNRYGRWERVIDDPDADEVRLVISTDDVSALEKDVWRDACGGVVWGLLLLATGAFELAVISGILSQFV